MSFFQVLLFGGGGGNPLADLFGLLTRWLYIFFDSYGWAIIIFTVILKGALIPLSLRSQKAMTKQQALTSKNAEIQRMYPNDKPKQQEEMAKLMKENGAGGMFGGCIMMFIPLFIIWPVYSIVRAPLVYLTQVSRENMSLIGNMLQKSGMITEQAAKMAATDNISIIHALQSNAKAVQEAVSNGYIKMGQMIDMNFLGIDLSVTPTINMGLIREQPGTYLPLLGLAALVLVTSVLMTWLNIIMRPNYKADKEAKALAKKNPARSEQVSKTSSDGQMKFMSVFSIGISLFFTFSQPSAMGAYWVVQNVIGIVQQVITYFMYTKPLEMKKKEMAAIKSVAFTKGIKTAEQMAQEAIEPKRKKKKANTGIPEVVESEENKDKKPEGYQRQKRKK